ncbi:MAG TPA: pyridoxine 5'-phosphate synthase [Gemmatimonadales bacterium]
MRLYVNIDHVATLREARKTDEPDPVAAALLCQEAGADGITAHLREDRRHIQDRDVEQLATASRVFNLELATSRDIVDLACRLRPHQATIVPERREEVTTEGGLDLHQPGEKLRDTIRRLQDSEVRVSLFIDPEMEAVERAKELGVAAIELHTGRYAHSWRENDTALKELSQAARRGVELGLAVHAGHGLTTANVAAVAAIPEVEELNIGHSIVSRAVMVGMRQAVLEMRRAMGHDRESKGSAG